MGSSDRSPVPACFSSESPCLCLSLLLPPLCLSPAPSSLGPPHQSSYLLPSPSHPKTQQVEHWFRTSLWPISPCPDISMMCSAQALLPAGIALGLAGLGCLAGCTSVSSPLLPSAWLPVSSPSLLLWLYSLLHCSRVPLLLPQETRWVHVPCSSVQAPAETWNS